MSDPIVDEGKKDVDESLEESKDKHPETVPYEKYVGIKEKFNRVEKELKGQVSSLEEQLKSTVSTEEHTKIKGDLEKLSGELTSIKDASLTEKKSLLVKKNVPEETIKDMTVEQIDTVLKVLGASSPKPDMGMGGGNTDILSTQEKLGQGISEMFKK